MGENYQSLILEGWVDTHLLFGYSLTILEKDDDKILFDIEDDSIYLKY